MKIVPIASVAIIGALASSVLPSQAAPMSALCAVLVNERNELAALQQQAATEKNSIMRTNIKNRIAARFGQYQNSIIRFLQTNTADSYTGKVASFSASAATAELIVELQCGATFSLSFNDANRTVTPFTPWRSVLENIVVGDKVSFSAHFGPADYQFVRAEFLNDAIFFATRNVMALEPKLSGIATDLRKE